MESLLDDSVGDLGGVADQQSLSWFVFAVVVVTGPGDGPRSLARQAA
jgi:hypothetical protein